MEYRCVPKSTDRYADIIAQHARSSEVPKPFSVPCGTAVYFSQNLRINFGKNIIFNLFADKGVVVKFKRSVIFVIFFFAPDRVLSFVHCELNL